MYKIIGMLLVLSTLVGCSKAIYPSDQVIADSVCAANGGVHYFSIVSGNRDYLEVVCKNKALFTVVERATDRYKNSLQKEEGL